MELSVTQQYMICAMNEKGKISGFNKEKIVCMIASGMLELQMDGCIELEHKRVKIIKELSEEKKYLKPLYDFFNQRRPVKVEKIIDDYNYSSTDKKLRMITEAIEKSLEKKGLVTVTETDTIIKRKNYMPTKKAVHDVIDMVRSEFLNNGEISENIACLAFLLQKSKIINAYFSSFEQKEIRNKLREILNSESGKLSKKIEYIENVIAMMTVLAAIYSN